MTFGAGITYYREKANLTIDQLSELAGVSRGSIMKLENNDHVSERVVESAARALSVSVDDLKNVKSFSPLSGFGGKIRQYREAKSLSQEQLGSMVGVSRQQISTWEKEESSPSRCNAEKLCGSLQVHFRLIFAEHETIKHQSLRTNELTSLLQEAMPRDAMELELLRLWRQVDQLWKLRTLYFLTGDDFYFDELNRLTDKHVVTDLDSHRLLREMRHRLK